MSLSDNIVLDNQPPPDIIEHFAKFSITLPIHQQKIRLQLDSHCDESTETVQNCFPLHVGLSLIEYILRECPHVAFWLKDHFLPSDHVLFKDEVHLSDSQTDEILNLIRDSSKWPFLVFRDNKQIRSMLHVRKSTTNTAYGLYLLAEDDRIYMNSQLIREAAKAPSHLQTSYSIMIAIKYLHEFAHHVYAKYGRLHLLNSFGIPLEKSTCTPIGILRGESGNRLEEAMLGFVLSHGGHLNIPMNIKVCLAHSNMDDHLRLIDNNFIDKLLQRATYDVSWDKHNFLHYDQLDFASLQRYCFEKAADVHPFTNHDDYLQGIPIKKLILSDDDDDDQDIQPFYSSADKLLL